jgi:hypothetical protein
MHCTAAQQLPKGSERNVLLQIFPELRESSHIPNASHPFPTPTLTLPCAQACTSFAKFVIATHRAFPPVPPMPQSPEVTQALSEVGPTLVSLVCVGQFNQMKLTSPSEVDSRPELVLATTNNNAPCPRPGSSYLIKVQHCQ